MEGKKDVEVKKGLEKEPKKVKGMKLQVQEVEDDESQEDDDHDELDVEEEEEEGEEEEIEMEPSLGPLKSLERTLLNMDDPWIKANSTLDPEFMDKYFKKSR